MLFSKRRQSKCSLNMRQRLSLFMPSVPAIYVSNLDFTSITIWCTLFDVIKSGAYFLTIVNDDQSSSKHHDCIDFSISQNNCQIVSECPKCLKFCWWLAIANDEQSSTKYPGCIVFSISQKQLSNNKWMSEKSEILLTLTSCDHQMMKYSIWGWRNSFQNL